MAQRQAGHDVGLHPPFKYLLYCVKAKYSWGWEMCLGLLELCGCRGGSRQPVGCRVCVPRGGDPPLQWQCSVQPVLPVTPATAVPSWPWWLLFPGCDVPAVAMTCLLWMFPGDIASAAALL